MSHRLDLERYRELVVTETAALAAAGRDHLDAHVPSCPEWDVAALLQHLWGVQEFWRLIVDGEHQDRTAVVRASHPEDGAVADALESGAHDLVAVLASKDPLLEVYSWADEETVAWVTRRQAHEAAVHRWDGQNAVGTADPIPTDLAVDGIDEWFECMVEPTAGHSVIRLEAVDADAAWHCDTGGRRVVQRSPDGVVHGTASDLLLSLWRRRLIADLVTRGDTNLARRLVAGADI